MARPKTFRSATIPISLTAGAGAEVKVSQRSPLSLSLSRAFTGGGVQFQYSSASKGDKWFPLQTELLAPGLRELAAGLARRVRAFTTADITVGDPIANLLHDLSLAPADYEEKFRELVLDVKSAVDTGDPEFLDGLQAIATVTGFGTATVQLQISLSETDDTTWHNYKAALTANGHVIVPRGKAERVRLNTTAHSAGTLVGDLSKGFSQEPVEGDISASPLIAFASGQAAFTYAPGKSQAGGTFNSETALREAAEKVDGNFKLTLDDTDDNDVWLTTPISLSAIDHPEWGRADIEARAGVSRPGFPGGGLQIILPDGCKFSEAWFRMGKFILWRNQADSSLFRPTGTKFRPVLIEGSVLSQEGDGPYIESAGMSPGTGSSLFVGISGRTSALGVVDAIFPQSVAVPCVNNNGIFNIMRITMQDQCFLNKNALGAPNQGLSINFLDMRSSDININQQAFLDLLNPGVATFLLPNVDTQRMFSFPSFGAAPFATRQDTETALRNASNLRFTTAGGDITQDIPFVDNDVLGQEKLTEGQEYELTHEVGGNKLFGVAKLGRRLNGVLSVGSFETLTPGGNYADGQQVTIDSSGVDGGANRVFTFQATLTDVNGNVQLGGDLATSLANLAAHINGAAGAGTLYAASGTADPTVSAVSDATTLTATGKIGGAQNDVVSLATDVGAWGAGTLGGGSGSFEVPATATARYDSESGLGATPGWRERKAVGVDAALGPHLADTANPHATGIDNLDAGSLTELNAAVSDATLDDSGDSRTPSGAAGGGLAGTYPDPTLAALSVDTAELAAQAVTAAKAEVFVSVETLATGASQNIAHGLSGVPSLILVSVTEGHDGASSQGDLFPDVAEGAHDATNVVVTITAGARFKVLAWV